MHVFQRSDPEEDRASHHSKQQLFDMWVTYSGHTILGTFFWRSPPTYLSHIYVLWTTPLRWPYGQHKFTSAPVGSLVSSFHRGMKKHREPHSHCHNFASTRLNTSILFTKRIHFIPFVDKRLLKWVWKGFFPSSTTQLENRLQDEFIVWT